MATLEKALIEVNRYLNVLRGREATFGGNAPFELLNEINSHAEAATLLKEALAQNGLTDAALDTLKTSLLGLVSPIIVEKIDIETLRPPVPLQPFEPETVLIPSGFFLMGSDPEDYIPSTETPQHEVELADYQIGIYPITNEQYAEFIKQNKQHAPPKKVGWLGRKPRGNLNHPVVMVTWFDAMAYCRWLSDLTGRTYRLPTEAEWERAARGDEGQIYPWGNEWDEGCCNTNQSMTTPVDAFPDYRSPYGCFDMAGNVLEWTSTAWGMHPQNSEFLYPYGPSDGRENLEEPYWRILRGGSFEDKSEQLRCAARFGYPPDSKIKRLGFRVVLEV